jgi:hypothetical protein
VGWISTFTTLNALVQLNSPVWVKSRVIALYQMCFLAAWSVGATAGGVIATHVGAAHAASVFAIGALAAAAFTARQGLPGYEPRGTEHLSTPPPASARAH